MSLVPLSYMATLWSAVAFVVIPVGAACLVLLLSDFRPLQKLAMMICSVRVALGPVQLTVSSIFAFLSSVIFLFQTVTTILTQKAHVEISMKTNHVEMMDRLRMKEWRNDRNWWIALFACTLWLIVWRLQIWTRRYCFTPPTAEKGVAAPPQAATVGKEATPALESKSTPEAKPKNNQNKKKD